LVDQPVEGGDGTEVVDCDDALARVLRAETRARHQGVEHAATRSAQSRDGRGTATGRREIGRDLTTRDVDTDHARAVSLEP
jgi:hypothetical protein